MASRRCRKRAFWALTFGSIGVVYGDIGTSPLYALRVAVLAAGGEHGIVTQAAVFGVLSLIFWSLIVVVTLKYVLILLRADNNGEGGTLALTALAFTALGRRTPLGARARHCRRVDVLRLDADHAGAVGAVGGRRPQRRDGGVRALRAAAHGDHSRGAVLGAVARHGAGLGLLRADHHSSGSWSSPSPAPSRSPPTPACSTRSIPITGSNSFSPTASSAWSRSARCSWW